MAYIPDEAIDRMAELSAGAWRLYCFLARCRNQKTGRCYPSARTSAEAIDVHLKNIFKLRKELSDATWAQFQGDEAMFLFGFGGSKNATTDVAVIEDAPNGSKNATTEGPSSKNATADVDTIGINPIRPGGSKNTTPSPVVAKTLLDGSKNATNGSKNATPYKEHEPANKPAKEPSGADAPNESQVIWKQGVSLLETGGMAAAAARSLLGKLAKDYGKATLARAIETVEGANPASPREYLVKVLQNIKNGSKGNDYAEQRKRSAQRDLARFRTDWKAKFRAARDGRAKMGSK